MAERVYLPRVVEAELDELFATAPALAIDGAKGVGKTATAERRARSAYRLDDPALRSLAMGDPQVWMSAPQPVLLDEWQLVPALWDAVRRAVDADPSPGRYLLTGSAVPPDLPSHSGAGRILSVRMRPLSLAERRVARTTVSLQALLSGKRPVILGRSPLTLADYANEVAASGFPGFRGFSGRALRAHLDSYLHRIVEREFVEQGHRERRPATLRRWMQAYAAATATVASLETIRGAATGGDGETPAKTTAAAYRDVLQALWLLDPLPGWLPTRNRMSRVLQAPKHHLVDPALAARLLHVDAEALLAGGQGAITPPDGTLLMGNLFESLVAQSVRVYAQGAEARVFHLRERDGRHEVDLIVERADQRVLAIECKLGGSVHDADVKHLLWLREKIGDALLDAVVVHTGPEAYRRADGIGVVPAALLGP